MVLIAPSVHCCNGGSTDRRLDSVYGDHPHHNDGRHLDGGVVDDPFWQGRWKRIVQLPLMLTLYSVPS